MLVWYEKEICESRFVSHNTQHTHKFIIKLNIYGLLLRIMLIEIPSEGNLN